MTFGLISAHYNEDIKTIFDVTTYPSEEDCCKVSSEASSLDPSKTSNKATYLAFKATRSYPMSNMISTPKERIRGILVGRTKDHVIPKLGSGNVRFAEREVEIGKQEDAAGGDTSSENTTSTTTATSTEASETDSESGSSSEDDSDTESSATSVTGSCSRSTDSERGDKISTTSSPDPLLKRPIDRSECGDVGGSFSSVAVVASKDNGANALPQSRCVGLMQARRHQARAGMVTICLAYCRYDLVREMSKRYGILEVGEDSPWSIFWTDFSVSLERALEMKRHQVINHFPGMTTICRKDLLARNLNRMKRLFPEDYNIFPHTWCLPNDNGDLQAYAAAKRGKTYICKPEMGCQGRGIFLVKNIRDLNPFGRIICQLYIHRPFLIDGLKFDLRIYVLITSCDPLRIWVHNEGLARFATAKYNAPSQNNTENCYMHLTNYSLNKYSRDFVSEGANGTKRKVSSIYEWMREAGHDTQTLQKAIDDVIIKTVLSAHPILRHHYRTCFPHHNLHSACFEILGFDILIDHKLKPYVIEVNHSPSFHTDTQLDGEIKEALLNDTFAMLDLQRLQQAEGIKRDVGGTGGAGGEELSRSQLEWELRHCGGYRLIYPTEESHVYDKFLCHQLSYLFQEMTQTQLKAGIARYSQEKQRQMQDRQRLDHIRQVNEERKHNNSKQNDPTKKQQNVDPKEKLVSEERKKWKERQLVEEMKRYEERRLTEPQRVHIPSTPVSMGAGGGKFPPELPLQVEVVQDSTHGILVKANDGLDIEKQEVVEVIEDEIRETANINSSMECVEQVKHEVTGESLSSTAQTRPEKCKKNPNSIPNSGSKSRAHGFGSVSSKTGKPSNPSMTSSKQKRQTKNCKQEEIRPVVTPKPLKDVKQALAEELKQARQGAQGLDQLQPKKQGDPKKLEQLRKFEREKRFVEKKLEREQRRVQQLRKVEEDREKEEERQATELRRLEEKRREQEKKRSQLLQRMDNMRPQKVSQKNSAQSEHVRKSSSKDQNWQGAGPVDAATSSADGSGAAPGPTTLPPPAPPRLSTRNSPSITRAHLNRRQLAKLMSQSLLPVNPPNAKRSFTLCRIVSEEDCERARCLVQRSILIRSLGIEHMSYQLLSKVGTLSQPDHELFRRKYGFALMNYERPNTSVQ